MIEPLSLRGAATMETGLAVCVNVGGDYSRSAQSRGSISRLRTINTVRRACGSVSNVLLIIYTKLGAAVFCGRGRDIHVLAAPAAAVDHTMRSRVIRAL